MLCLAENPSSTCAVIIGVLIITFLMDRILFATEKALKKSGEQPLALQEAHVKQLESGIMHVVAPVLSIYALCIIHPPTLG